MDIQVGFRGVVGYRGRVVKIGYRRRVGGVIEVGYRRRVGGVVEVGYRGRIVKVGGVVVW